LEDREEFSELLLPEVLGDISRTPGVLVKLIGKKELR